MPNELPGGAYIFTIQNADGNLGYYKLVKQLIDMIKKVADDNPIVLSITSKLDIDPVFERLGFENGYSELIGWH